MHRQLAEKFGFLVIKLDAGTIKIQIFPELAKRYFSDRAADFQLTVVNQADASDVIYASQPTAAIVGQPADASVALFDLSPDNFSVFINRELLSTIRSGQRERSKIIINQSIPGRVESEEIKIPQPHTGNRVNVFTIQRGSGNTSPLVLPRQPDGGTGKWILNIRHADGSLETYITNTRRKNLAVSFGILSLLAVSVCLIFVSAQRASRLAQRQMDFVSAVSHEFRTPLAVIYSAGENLTDGVVRHENQVSQYGNLIKREGKKLSAMVEQILEFAGARSGKQKYDLRQMSVENVIENALAECEPLIKEKNFTVEKEVSENLPRITGDEKMLSQAIQNLIVNSLKYSNGNSWLKVSARGDGGEIKIIVEDKGIGISPKDLKHIFEPFYRSKTVVDEQIHGNGLGLSLVKQTVEAHGGKIDVKSEIGYGSRFTIVLKS
jgi:two-component system, OmpR family, sensor histidine kinase SenX3